MTTLEDLIVDNIRTSAVIDENVEFNFESSILDLYNLNMESQDFDIDSTTIDMALECASEIEVTEEASSTIGNKLKEFAKKLVKFIWRLCVAVYNVITAPFLFIYNLISSGSFKKAAQCIKYQFKGSDAGVQQMAEEIFKMTPSAETIKKRADLMDEFVKFQMEYIREGKKIYLDNISIYFFTDTSGEYRSHYSETHGGSEYSGGNSAVDKTDDEYERKQKEFNSKYEDIVSGKTNCTSDQDFLNALSETEKLKKMSDAQGVINETQSQVKIIEKMLNGNDWNKLPVERQQKIIGYLNHLKALLNSLSIMSADQAKDIKAIYESTNKIIKTVEKK